MLLFAATRDGSCTLIPQLTVLFLVSSGTPQKYVSRSHSSNCLLLHLYSDFPRETSNNRLVTTLNSLIASNDMDMILQAVQDIIGYQFREQLILWEAMQAAGSNVRFAGGREFVDGNKRLAVIGDTVLQLVLAEQWYSGGTSRGILDGEDANRYKAY